MKKLIVVFLALVLSTVGGAQPRVYGGDNHWQDSLMTTAGCFTQTAAEYKVLADSLGWNTPFERALLDSSGIRVVVPMRSSGMSAGNLLTWCPAGDVTIHFRRGKVMLWAGRLTVPVGDKWVLMARAKNPTMDINDYANVDALNFGYDNWRDAVAALAPEYNDPALPPIVYGPDAPPVVVTPIPPRPPAGGDQWRLTVVARRGPANSVQMADFELLESVQQVGNGWPAGTTVVNPGGESMAGEEPKQLLDGDLATKWIDLKFAADGSAVQGRSVLVFTTSIRAVKGYRYRTANDEPSRDPVTLLLDWSTNDGSTWSRIDSTTVDHADPGRLRWVTRVFGTDVTPTPQPPIAPAPLPIAPTSCAGSPVGAEVPSNGIGFTATRSERTEVRRGAICTAVIVFGNVTATRYRVHRPSCRVSGEWVQLPTLYTSRASALTAAAAVPLCVAGATKP